jgi:hypothetical protein
VYEKNDKSPIELIYEKKEDFEGMEVLSVDE